MAGDALEEAAACFTGVPLVPAQNNLGVVLFQLGRIAEAFTVLEAAAKADPDNLLALGWLALLALYQGDRVRADTLADRLATANPRRSEDARGQLLSLLMLGRDADAWSAFARGRGQEWFAGEAAAHARALLLHFGACAASRLGRRDEAKALWREVRGQTAGTAIPVAENLSSAEAAAGCPAVIDVWQVLPRAYIRAAAGVKTDPLPATASGDASLDYLTAVYRCGDRMSREFVRAELMDRIRAGDDAAAAVLRSFAALPIGNNQDRTGLLGFLRQQGQLGADEEVALWDGQTVRQVRFHNTEITRDPLPDDLPEPLRRLMEQAVIALREGDLLTGEVRLLAFLAQRPDDAAALSNLAHLRSRQGRDAEARELLERAVTLEPDYLFGRCNLAALRITNGDIQGGAELLDGLLVRPRLHIDEAFVLYGTHVLLHDAQGDHASADQFVSMLEPMVLTDYDQQRFAGIKQRRLRFTVGKQFMEIMDRLTRQ